MTHDELRRELQGFADSTDTHVTTEDAVLALSLLVERIESEGLVPHHAFPEPTVTEEER